MHTLENSPERRRVVWNSLEIIYPAQPSSPFGNSWKPAVDKSFSFQLLLQIKRLDLHLIQSYSVKF